jgi:hypothetical protein
MPADRGARGKGAVIRARRVRHGHYTRLSAYRLAQ